MTRAADDARARDLLADRALQGLGSDEQHELDALLRRHPELDDDSFELAAAAIDLACTDVTEPLPPSLRSRILERLEPAAQG